MRSRMRDFLNALLMFVHNQIDYVFSSTSLKVNLFLKLYFGTNNMYISYAFGDECMCFIM